MPDVEICIADSRIDTQVLARLAEAWFGDMIKIVVDIDRNVVAAGGELRADAVRDVVFKVVGQGEDL